MGVNIQAVIAYLAGIALPFAGFVGTLGANVSATAQDMGHIGWFLSFTTSFVLYYLICLVWPTPPQRLIKERKLGWEGLSYEEVVAEDGTEMKVESHGEGYVEKTSARVGVKIA